MKEEAIKGILQRTRWSYLNLGSGCQRQQDSFEIRSQENLEKLLRGFGSRGSIIFCNFEMAIKMISCSLEYINEDNEISNTF